MSQIPTPSQPAETLEQLQRDLSDRRSIVHLARAGVACVVAAIFALAAGKLFWDSIHLSYLAVLATVIAVVATLFCLGQYRRASRLLVDERRQFEQMKQLRQLLHVDDPSALLPQ